MKRQNCILLLMLSRYILRWDYYKRTDDERKLKLLLNYNSVDARNLETLMVMAYNMKPKNTPFYETYKII